MMPHNTLLLLILLLVAGGLLTWIVIGIARSPYTPLQTVLYWGAELFTRFLWRAQTAGELPLPPGQGGVIICNHRTSVDPFFILVAARRPVHWLVAREYCEHWFLGFFLRACEAIPVGRAGIDTAATKIAIRKVAQGGVVGMFPEGRINVTDQFMLPVRPGAVLVALRAKAPIIPCYIEGAPYDETPLSPFRMPARVVARFGEPLDLSEYYEQDMDSEAIGRLTQWAVSKIAELAGRTDFEPQLAGRKWMPEASGEPSEG